MMYTPAFGSMFEGSMCGAGSDVFAVWLYALSRCDSFGEIELFPKPVAALIGCTEQAVKKAIAYLTSPDPESRSPDEEGRRLVPTGQHKYRIVNHSLYQQIRSYAAKREADRERMAKKRSSKKGRKPNESNNSREESQRVAHGNGNGNGTNTCSPASAGERRGSIPFEDFWSIYPRKVSKKRSNTAWLNLTVKNQRSAMAALPNHVLQWEAEGREASKIPHASTWINQERWNDELEVKEAAGKHPPINLAEQWKREDEALMNAEGVQ